MTDQPIRIEHDLLGERPVQASACYGVKLAADLVAMTGQRPA